MGHYEHPAILKRERGGIQEKGISIWAEGERDIQRNGGERHLTHTHTVTHTHTTQTQSALATHTHTHTQQWSQGRVFYTTFAKKSCIFKIFLPYPLPFLIPLFPLFLPPLPFFKKKSCKKKISCEIPVLKCITSKRTQISSAVVDLPLTSVKSQSATFLPVKI